VFEVAVAGGGGAGAAETGAAAAGGAGVAAAGVGAAGTGAAGANPAEAGAPSGAAAGSGSPTFAGTGAAVDVIVTVRSYSKVGRGSRAHATHPTTIATASTSLPIVLPSTRRPSIAEMARRTKVGKR
jgi:hypothetical protein